MDQQRKEHQWEVMGYTEKGRRKINDIRRGSRLKIDLQRKEQKWWVLQRSGREKASDRESGHTRHIG